MKKKLILTLLLSLLFLPIVSASTISKENIDPRTYVIGEYIFTRKVNDNYDGVLTTQRIMLASKSIASNNESDMIIYYRNASGDWINAINGNAITVPDNFNIKIVDLRNIETNAYTATLLPGREFNAKIKALAANGSATYETVNNTITAITKASALPEFELTDDNIISGDDSDNLVYAWVDNGTLYYYVKSFTGESEIYLNADANNMFDNLTALTSLDLREFDFSKVTNADDMFAHMTALTKIITPKVNASVDIDLDKLMFDDAKNSYIKFTSTTPTAEELNIGYYVTFLNDTTANATVFTKVGVPAGTAVSEPDGSPDKEGNEFVGWQIRIAGQESPVDYDFATLVTGEITLIPRWLPEIYAIRFVDEDGTTILASQTRYYGGRASFENVAKEGYAVASWHLVVDGVASETAYNFNTAITGNIILQVKWQINEYDVTFDTDGGIPVPSVEKVEYQSTATRPVEDPAKEHYDFDNWYLVENGEMAVSPYNFSTQVVGDIELKAKYTPKSYSVTFDSNGGSSVAPDSVEYLNTVDEPDEPTREGYNFIAWHIVVDEVASEIPYDFNTPITGPITLKAEWEIKTYAVTFDSDGGSEVAGQTITHGETVEEPEEPTKDDCTFVAWHLMNGLDMTLDPYGFDTPVTGELSLKAEWLCE